MICEKCGKPMVWEGSIARGRMVCNQPHGEIHIDSAIVSYQPMFKMVIGHPSGGGVVKCTNCDEFMHVDDETKTQICDYCGISGVVFMYDSVQVWP